MGRRDKFKSRSKNSYSRKSKSLPDKFGAKERFIVFSFKDFDRNQGQSFKDWETDELLALAVEKLSQISNLTMSQAIQQQIIKIYTKVDFPPNNLLIVITGTSVTLQLCFCDFKASSYNIAQPIGLATKVNSLNLDFLNILIPSVGSVSLDPEMKLNILFPNFANCL